jgi:hypothetical protein
MPGERDPLYVLARHVLINALEALADHRRAVILIGAQAIYLHIGEGDLAVAPFTTDGDIALDPAELADEPKLEELMTKAGFSLAPGSNRPGTWVGPNGIVIDLMVPAAVGGAGRRGARLGVHGNLVASKGRGLEGVLIDNEAMTIAALDDRDRRRIDAVVAGPAALLVAKLHKIADRQGDIRRADDKDALDVYCLLQAVSTAVLVSRMQRLLGDSRSHEVAEEALAYLRTMFGTPESAGSQMAARAVELLEDPDTIAASCAALAGDLLDSLRA